MTAAIYARRSGKSVLLLEREGYGGQIAYAPRVENYPGVASVGGAELAERMLEQMLALDAETDVGEVLSVERTGENFTVRTEDGVYESRAVILATGAKHRHLGLPDEEELLGHGVSYCAVCDGGFYKNGVTAVVGGAIPKEYIPAVDAGIQGAMEAGVLAGYPVVDVKVTLYDGSYHEVDSSEMAFKIAGSMAFKEACKKADPVILEPIMKVSVNVPDEYMGTVIGDITARRGNILGQITRTGSVQIDANVPLAEMFGYATDLRSKTQGRGNYSMEPSHNAELPKSKTEEIVKSRGKD